MSGARWDTEILGLEPGVVRLAPYDPAWARLYQEEGARLAAALGPRALDIQHVGSTSVPGLPAKPVLDIAIAVASFAAGHACVAPLQALGYQYYGEHGIPGRRYFVLRAAGEVTLVHVHMLAQSSAEWENHLLFRDYLRAHPAEKQAYQALKERRMAAHRDDREAYTEGKATYIRRVLALARR